MKHLDPNKYFPNDYSHSRAEFSNAVKAMKTPVETGSWKVASSTCDDLFVDYAWLPPLKKPKKLLVLISGIHGSETYTGAAILKLFMEEILPQVNRDETGVFIVHSMNPFGFKNHRRCTENHVNLNRNFSVSGELFKTKNPESKRLNDLFLTRKPIGSHHSKLAASLRKHEGKVYFGDDPLDHIIKSVSPGQFERADDLEFGGTKTEPQTQALIDKMKQLMPQFEEVVALDLHTGLGDRGRLHILTDGNDASLHPQLFEKLFKPEEDKDIYTFTPATTEGFYTVQGATNSMFRDLAKPNQKVCAVTLEFGTLGHSLEQQLSDMNYSINDHEGYHYGYTDEKIKKEITDLNFSRSYPNDDQWRSSVLTAAEGFLLKIVERMQKIDFRRHGGGR